MRVFDAGARQGEQRVHDRVLTVPNAITAVRLAGLPVFVWLATAGEAPLVALLVLVAIGATDWVDGYVARRFDQVSRLGILADPLVDRLLVITTGVTLLVMGLLPLWLLVAVVVRDVLVVGGALLLFGGIPPIPVTRTGKAATATLLLALPLLLLSEVLGSDPLWLAALGVTIAGVTAYYGAGVQYARAAVELRRGAGR